MSSESNTISLFDSLSESIQPLPSIEGKGLAWYTCGPTTYAPAHLGHARTYVCLDIVRRVLEARVSRADNFIPPLFVMNITDVDDKILAAAAEKQLSPIALARKFEAEFWRDLDALNCMRPHVVTRVTECVGSHIVPFIERLVDQGMAYEIDDGVYFHVRAYNERLGLITKYGKLAPPAAAQDIEITSRNGPDAEAKQKKDPRDFVLWKRKKPDEALAWPSPWGEGRPGWHIECSAMIEEVQAQFEATHQFLVHAGGVDLKFPHHTNEIAQSEAYRQTANWIPFWVHTGHLYIDGLKMSKSLKNFISIQDFLAGYNIESALESPSDDFRLWCLGLSGSYRGPATFSNERLAEARTIRQQIFRFLMDGQLWVHRQEIGIEQSSKSWEGVDHKLFSDCQEARRVGMEALHCDMDGSLFIKQCLLIVDIGYKYIYTLRKEEGAPIEPMITALSILRDMLSLVGFTNKTTKAGLENTMFASGASTHSGRDENKVTDLLVQFRSAVRHAALDDARAGLATDRMKQILDLCDSIRDLDLPQIGVEVLDGGAEGDGERWRICLPKPKLHDQNSESQEGQKQSPQVNLGNVALEDLFRVGQYEGLFSEYTSDGIPTHNADGSDVSKSALKKLLKKREAHMVRLQAK